MMAKVTTQMSAIGNEPKTCLEPFARGEIMYAVEYDNGEPAGWHNKECLDYWVNCGRPKCALEKPAEPKGVK